MEEKIFFANSKGDKLCGILSDRFKHKGKAIVVICHGLHSNKDRKTYTSFEKELNSEKIATLRFDFWGHGESKGVFENMTIDEGVDDAIRAVKFLKKKGHENIGLLGSSFGGLVCLLAAVKLPDIKFIALQCPVFDYPESYRLTMGEEFIKQWKKKGYRVRRDEVDGTTIKLRYTFYENALTQNAYSVASRLSMPILIVHGDKDEFVPISQSIRLTSLIPSCKLKIIKGADHHFTKDVDRQKKLDLICQFIVQRTRQLV